MRAHQDQVHCHSKCKISERFSDRPLPLSHVRLSVHAYNDREATVTARPQDRVCAFEASMDWAEHEQKSTNERRGQDNVPSTGFRRGLPGLHELHVRGTRSDPKERSPFSREPYICRPETIGDRDSRSASYHVMPRRLDGVNCTPHAFICAKTHAGHVDWRWWCGSLRHSPGC